MTLERFHEMSKKLYDIANAPDGNPATMTECEKAILFSHLTTEKRSGPLFRKYMEFMSNWPGPIMMDAEVAFVKQTTWQELFEECITNVKP